MATGAGSWLAVAGAATGSFVLVLGVYAWADRRRLAERGRLRARLAAIAAAGAGAPGAARRAAPSGTAASGSARPPALLLPGRPGAWRAAASWLGALTGARRRREAAIERQLPDAVDMLVNALRAGYALSAALQFVGEQQAPPLGPEFARVAGEQQLGGDTREALEGLQARLGSLDARLVVLALQVQRETGGNLAEILGTIAQVIRDRLEFRAQVEVLTAESRLSAAVLALLPMALYAVVRAMNPEYMATLTDTPAGRLMLGYGVASLVVGTLVLRRMAHVEV